VYTPQIGPHFNHFQLPRYFFCSHFSFSFAGFAAGPSSGRQSKSGASQQNAQCSARNGRTSLGRNDIVASAPALASTWASASALASAWPSSSNWQQLRAP